MKCFLIVKTNPNTIFVFPSPGKRLLAYVPAFIIGSGIPEGESIIVNDIDVLDYNKKFGLQCFLIKGKFRSIMKLSEILNKEELEFQIV